MTRISRSMAVLLVSCAALLVMMVAAIKPTSSRVLAAPNPSAQIRDQAEPRWEYQTMFAKSPEALITQANQGGTESWELVSATHVLNTNRYEWVGFFKRLKR